MVSNRQKQPAVFVRWVYLNFLAAGVQVRIGDNLVGKPKMLVKSCHPLLKFLFFMAC